MFRHTLEAGLVSRLSWFQILPHLKFCLNENYWPNFFKNIYILYIFSQDACYIVLLELHASIKQ